MRFQNLTVELLWIVVVLLIRAVSGSADKAAAGIWVDGVGQAAWLTGISMTSTPFWNLTPSTSLGNWF
jgi:hypothetical protein